MKLPEPPTDIDVADSGNSEPALQALIGIETLQHSAHLAGLAGGVLLLLTAIVAWLGTEATGLDIYWLVWAAVPAFIAAFAGPTLGRVLLSRQSLTRWRMVLLAIMAASSTAWAFASGLAVSAVPASQILLVVGWLALSVSLLPTLTWMGGLAVQLAVQLGFMSVFAYLPGHNLSGLLLPLGLWLSLAFLSMMAAMYARRVDLAKGDLHFMRFESSELQGLVSRAKKELVEAEHERVTLERELAEILDLAEDANRAKTEFLATMSHEIRTPLNGILPILEMLRDTPLNDEQIKLVRTAQSSSRHLLRIINDILDFAKVESGKLQLETIEIDVREMVGSVTELMRSSAGNQNLKLSASVADDVPHVVRGDPIRLRQVLINLVSNAIKFTQEGGIRIEVSRGQTSQKEVELLFAVADTGVGMSAETADRLFQAFTQADASTTRKHGGTGLGLVICKRLVELMGGKIGVRSAIDQGSTFWFLVPLRKSVMEVPSARRDLKGVRVLTVIADPELAAKVSADLRAWDVVEESCSDAGEASAKLHSSSLLGASWSYELVLIEASGIEQKLTPLLADIRAVDGGDQIHIVVSTRSNTLASRIKRDYGALILADAMRSEPLRRLLHRLFDVESTYFGSPDIRFDEIYDDLNVSVGDAALDDASSDSPQPLFSGRVLLVEDNPVNLGVVKKALSKLGLGCSTAEDGEEALAQFKRQHFHIVFMDCQMPVMDGYEATRRIRELEAEKDIEPTPIVAMTANAMAGDREKCLNAGMDDYLAKPVGLDELRTCVSGWLAHRDKLAASQDRQVPQYEPETPSNDSVLDDKVLQELRDIMEDDYVSLLRTYLTNAPQLVEAVNGAIAKGDVESMVLPVHSLKSSSANVGAMQLSALAREAEKHARAGDLDAAKRAFTAVHEAFVEAEEALQDLVANASVA